MQMGFLIGAPEISETAESFVCSLKMDRLTENTRYSMMAFRWPSALLLGIGILKLIFARCPRSRATEIPSGPWNATKNSPGMDVSWWRLIRVTHFSGGPSTSAAAKASIFRSMIVGVQNHRRGASGCGEQTWMQSNSQPG